MKTFQFGSQEKAEKRTQCLRLPLNNSLSSVKAQDYGYKMEPRPLLSVLFRVVAWCLRMETRLWVEGPDWWFVGSDSCSGPQVQSQHVCNPQSHLPNRTLCALWVCIKSERQIILTLGLNVSWTCERWTRRWNLVSSDLFTVSFKVGWHSGQRCITWYGKVWEVKSAHECRNSAV